MKWELKRRSDGGAWLNHWGTDSEDVCISISPNGDASYSMTVDGDTDVEVPIYDLAQWLVQWLNDEFANVG